MEPVKDEKPEPAQKLGTITGVFIPTTLNVLSILMYLRVYHSSCRLRCGVDE